MDTKVTALVLAGRRSGVLDPLAARAGVNQKAVVPINGKPLIEHTLSAVAACDRIGAIRVVAHESAEIEAIPLVASLKAEGRLTFTEAKFNLVDSVASGTEGADFPVLITTADNTLVTPEGYAEFIDKALAVKADAAAALARKEDVQAADPRGQAKFYEFKDGGFSNCNMYWIGNAGALDAAEIFRNGGQFVKFPSRIAKAFGLINLARFYFGIGDRDAIFAKVSKRFGYSIHGITMSNGEYAIDVDNERTYEVSEKLLAKRDAASL
ncbi:NTP transferase domain-containing protein [Parerythrobacter jejuensis]|uniref:NTP transferase domain-containing protein n=1 Tax=Parerythrobacter jejuensis TaxID=795812 RepID=A0A845AWI7_9SPHN|nr:NTP transferase domain-containing protein [Parerythrobacter jejuensis]MXP30391.1 NTP transferase domain-containing protein [Parerythrobacter jejuensis]MXP33151.1 NTP transferase domain-containing protein [Parerythrobacter jejuensis]